MKRTLFFVAGCAGLAALTWYAGAGAVGSALAALGVTGLTAIAILHLPVLALMGLAWWYAGRPIAGLSAFLKARLVRDAAAEVLPFSQLGGFAIGVRALTLSGAVTDRSSVSMFVDLVAEFAAKLPYTIAGILVLVALQPEAGLLMPLALGTVLVATGLLALFSFRRALWRLVERSGAAIVGKWSRLGAWDLRPALKDGFVFRRLLPCFFLHVICWFLGAAETWVIFHLMDVPVTAGQALAIDSLANALRTFGFFVPAAAGVQEGAYVAVCALFGLPAADAVAFSFARRAREIVLGLPGLALWHVMETRRSSRMVEVVGGESQPPA